MSKDKEKLLNAMYQICQDHTNDSDLIPRDSSPDNNTYMLIPRLERAALNQIEGGDAMVARYREWAFTARGHIVEALRLIEDPEARRLLISTHNSLSAFAEIQDLVDPMFEHRSRYLQD